MAKSQAAAKPAQFEIDTMPSKKAHETLRSLRSGRGGARRSKYSPIIDAIEDAKAGEIVVVKGVPMSGVMSVRNKIKRMYPDGAVTVKSVRDRENDGTFVLMSGRTKDFE